jgi:hypothetical protein
MAGLTVTALKDRVLDALQRLPPLQWRLVRRSRALVNADKRLMVVWSPKSACTTAYVWFAAQSGLLDELRQTPGSPHQHRRLRYYQSALYRDGLRLPLREFRIVRIIRDPYTRAASIYRHALMNRYLDPLLHDLPDDPRDRQRGLSFQEFLDLLATRDLRRADIHLQPQVRAVEALRPADVTINISKSDLFAALNRVEAEFGLAHTDFTNMAWLLDMERQRRARDEPVAGTGIDQRRFGQRAARGRAPFPAYRQLLTPAACRKIEQLYAADFAAYRGFL